MMNDPLEKKSSLPGFYQLPMSQRQKIIAKFSGLDEKNFSGACKPGGGIGSPLIDTFIENAIGAFTLPLGVATNFIIDGEETFVPMAVEESSVLAAASHGAKLTRSSGGFETKVDLPVTTGQIQIKFKKEPSNYEETLAKNEASLLSIANKGRERLIARGGGAKRIDVRWIEPIKSLIFHVHVHTADAMGANIVNSISEQLSSYLLKIYSDHESEMGLRILTNFADQRLARATCKIPAKVFSKHNVDGNQVIEKIVEAFEFAYYDIYRATTHNKGVMNGIDPVLIATGNDWRAVEAGAHAWAAKDGRYKPMTKWRIEQEDSYPKDKQKYLVGSIEIPLAVGTVGGVTKLHPTAQLSLEILNRPDAQKLAGIVACVGLAQNLAALRALSSEGIQTGHMYLHQKNLNLMQDVPHGAIANKQMDSTQQLGTKKL